MTDPGFISLDDAERRQGVPLDGANEPPPVMGENEYCAEPQTPAPIEEAATAGVRVPRQNSQGKIKLDIVDPITLQGKDVPERQWRVPGWIPDHAVTLDGGDAGFGKSTIKMQLATACATERQWLGLPTTPCKALYMACEDTREELHRRQSPINKLYNVEFRDLENLRWWTRVGQDNALVRATEYGGLETTDLYGRLMNEALDFGAQLLVIDSLHDVFFGNENHRGHARQFMSYMRDIAIEMQGAVVVVYHPSLSGRATGSGESGNTAWNAAARSRLYLRQEEGSDPDHRILERKKSNYAGLGEPIELRWRDGVFVPVGYDQTIFGAIERTRTETAFLECLDILASQGRNASASPNAGNYAPRTMAPMEACKGLKPKDLDRAMARLFDAGAIRVEEYGRPSAPKQHIVKVEK